VCGHERVSINDMRRVEGEMWSALRPLDRRRRYDA